MERDGVFCVPGLAGAGPTSSKTGELTGPPSISRPATIIPSASAVVSAAVRLLGAGGCEAEAHHYGVGANYADGLLQVVVPGAKIRFFAVL